MFLSRIKIVSRLAIGFGILMTIIVVVAASSIILARRTAASVVELQRETTIRREIKDVLIAANRARAATWAFVVTNDDKYVTSWEVSSLAAKGSFDNLDHIITTSISRAMLNTNIDLVEILTQKQKAIIDANNNGVSVSSPIFSKAIDDVKIAAGRFEASMAEFASRMDVTSAEAATAATMALNQASTLSMILAVGGILVGIILSWIIGRNIANPIENITRTMAAIAKGDFSTRMTGLDSKDEIGEMAKAVEIFRDNGLKLRATETAAAELRTIADLERAASEAARVDFLRQQKVVLASVADGLDRLAKGDLTACLSENFPAGYKNLRSDFNASAASLRQAMETISLVTDEIVTNSDCLAQASQDLSGRTQMQRSALAEAVSSLAFIISMVTDMAAGANEATRVVTATRDTAEASGQVVDQAVDAMGKIKAASNKISNIIGVIDEIAFQTNLLALNAGVEAARAGDAGRGFAVVASEVRALAQRSADAAKEIKALISDSSKQVENGVVLVGKTGEALKTIVTKFVEIDALVCQIAASSEGQAIALDEINTSVSRIDQVVQQNVAMVEDSSIATHALHSETQELASLVGRFNLGGQTAHAAHTLHRNIEAA